MNFFADPDPAPPPSSTVVVVEEVQEAREKAVVENGKHPTFASTLLAKKQAHTRDQSVTPEDNGVDEMEVDDDEDEAPPLVQIEPEEPEPKKKTVRKSRVKKQRLPRNKSLYAMRALQASDKPIFASLTMHRIVKTFTREVLHRPDVKYSKQAMQFLMRIVESLIAERLLLAQAICLQGGRKTLMLHHLLTAEHHIRSPNLTQWVVDDFKQEDGRLERSRFRNSRLGQL